MPEAVVLYHYFYPDDVISARHMDDLCIGLTACGWKITALPSNRGARNEMICYPPHDVWRNIAIHRIWRPPLKQATLLGRFCNALWMTAAWCLSAFRYKTNVLIVGTDPIMSVLVSLFWKRVQPDIVIAHWIHDLYPEAAIADDLLSEKSVAAKILKKAIGAAYRSCDIVIDIGMCMRRRLESYNHVAVKATLTPWALYEPATMPAVNANVRKCLFGDARVGLMYSGNFGRAHSCREFLALARVLRGESIHFSFGVRGNAVKELIEAITPQDTNVSLATFAPESELQQRLCAPDIHLVSLKSGWTGAVVPSKFFGSLAVGRPVLFAGSGTSSIAEWIKTYDIGWVLDADSTGSIAVQLKELTLCPEKLTAMKQRCMKIYQEHFSRHTTIKRWNELLFTTIKK